MKDKFLIGELSKIFNISTDTLRYYDKIGLLKPEYDANNRYRYYNLDKFFILSRILFLKSLDISLEDIKSYFKNQSTNRLLDLLKEEEINIDEKIQHLTNLKSKITSKIQLIEGANDQLDKIEVKHVPKRLGAFITIKDINNQGEIKHSFKNFENHFKSSSWLIEGQIYTSITKDDMLSSNFERFNYFVEILSDKIDADDLCIKTIPANNCACIVFTGAYNNFDYYYEKLIIWIKDNNFIITGDSIEKNIVDYGFTSSEDEYISEIQIPIRKMADS